uniref:Uncharacterized protein n=1 Tax=Oncorhynchus tshawytscha TaxID=74940 RepID=A0AAZ3PG98_ONCTS
MLFFAIDLLEPPTPVKDNASSHSKSKAKNCDLCPAMRAHIERNKQRALMLRQARLASRQSAGEGGGTSAKVAKAVDSGEWFFIDRERQEEQRTKKVVHQPAPVMEADYLLCDDCDTPFDGFLPQRTASIWQSDNCRVLFKRKKKLVSVCIHFLMMDVYLMLNTHLGYLSRHDIVLCVSRFPCSLEVWGSEEANESREENREVQKRINKKSCCRAVRSSVWTKDTSAHRHEYQPVNTCEHKLTYEEM